MKTEFPRPPVPDLGNWLNVMGNEALARMTLLANHVIATEPEAMQRLAQQAGKSLRLQWRSWPDFLPAALTARLPQPMPATWAVSAAGLLDFQPAATAADPSLATDAEASLVVTLDSGEIARWLLAAGQGRPPMDIQGDAALAAEVGWLADHLRWDIEDDLARVVGDAPAHQIARLMHWFVDAARRFAASGAGLARSTADGWASLRQRAGRDGDASS